MNNAQAPTSALATLLLALIKLYQHTLSYVVGQHCRFHPSCSTYAELAITRHGVLRGVYLTLRRLLRCHPWHRGGEDPIPD
ncbi:MAG TPA: membrane protein insertion efficiency factor YidD [Gammaproteobacteria bacterium]|nr:membrane protein insertion efficiency factor YidD [Gammaproteobacteria bacterium]